MLTDVGKERRVIYGKPWLTASSGNSGTSNSRNSQSNVQQSRQDHSGNTNRASHKFDGRVLKACQATLKKFLTVVWKEELIMAVRGRSRQVVVVVCLKANTCKVMCNQTSRVRRMTAVVIVTVEAPIIKAIKKFLRMIIIKMMVAVM